MIAWKYTVFTNDRPLMLLDDLIGIFDDYQGVDPAIFCRELLELDTMGFDGVDIWLNGDGGRVDAAMQIYHTILKTKTKVYTYNIGRQLSAHFLIGLAGYKRYWSDYAIGMTHDVQNVSDSALLELLNTSVSKMIAERSGKTIEEVQILMKVTTWFDADTALRAGFCDEIIPSGSIHRTKEKNPYIAYNLGLNKVSLIKTQSMSKVAVILGLNVASTDDVLASAVGTLKADHDKATNLVKELGSQVVEKDAKIEVLTKDLDEAKGKVIAFQDEVNTAKATNQAIEWVNAGKITEEAKPTWIENLKKDFEGTKKLGDSLGVNKAAPTLSTQPQGQAPVNMSVSGMLQSRIAEVQSNKK